MLIFLCLNLFVPKYIVLLRTFILLLPLFTNYGSNLCAGKAIIVDKLCVKYVLFARHITIYILCELANINYKVMLFYELLYKILL